MADLEKPEFTKEQLEAIKIVDKLYALEFDVNKAFEYYAQNRKEMICIAVNTEIHGFQHHLPKLFCDLIGMIKYKKIINSSILEKYISFIIEQEGMDYIDRIEFGESEIKFTPKEIELLKSLSKK
jgi:hypothetical protein